MAKFKQHLFIRLIYVLAALVLIAATGFQTLRLVAQRVASDFLYPYLSLSTVLGSQLSDKTLLLHSKTTLAAHLQQAREQNSLLAAQVAAASELKVENEQLRKILHLAPRHEIDCVYGEILVRDPLRWREYFSVNRGSDSGIVRGTPVFSLSHNPPYRLIFIGIVQNVSRHTCQVVTTLSRDIQLSVYLPRSDAYGFITGTRDHELPLRLANVDFLPADKRYEIGEPVVTTGFEKTMPPGISIGTIAAVDTVDSIFSRQNYLGGAIAPDPDFAGLRFVIMLVKRAGEGGDTR